MARSPSWRALAPLSLLLVAVTGALYAPVLGNGFVNYDDPAYVTANEHVLAGLTWSGVRWAFTTGHASNWHPLTWLAHMLDAQLFGERAGGHHLTSVVLHCLNALVLLALFRSATGRTWESAFVAAAFAWHPLHVESVAWASEKKDVLSTFFGLLALWAYVVYAQDEDRRRARRWYWSALALFALGLTSKSMLVTWPFVMLLLDAWPLGRFASGEPGRVKRLLLEKAPFLVLAVASSVVTYLVQRAGGSVSTLERLPFEARATNALVSYARYAGKSVWPADLSVLYPHPGGWPVGTVLLASAFLLAVTLVAFRRRRDLPFLFVGWAWFAGTLVPVIGLVQVGNQALADRYTYVPLIGLSIAVAWGAGAIVGRWPAARPALAAAGVAVLAGWALAARAQIGTWKDGETLFRHALSVTERNSVACNNLGFALQQQGRLGEALEMYRAALAIQPSYAQAHNNAGHVLAGEGKLDEAVEHYRTALRIDPELAEAHNNLGNALADQGKLDEAIEEYRLALQQEPDHAEAHSNLGAALARKGRWDESLEHFRAAIRLRPRYAGARGNLGNAYAAMRRFDEAIGEYEEALRLAPDDAQTHNNLANVLVEKGRFEEAVAHYRESLRLAPGNAETSSNLALALSRLGRSK